MQFCDDCGSMMVSEDGRMVCTDCGATDRRDEERASAFVSTEEQTDDDVIESSADDVHCDDCGHTKAWYTIKQTGSADEPPTRFFKCTECGHRWREYS